MAGSFIGSRVALACGVALVQCASARSAHEAAMLPFRFAMMIMGFVAGA